MNKTAGKDLETPSSEGPATQIVYNRLLTMLINGKFKVGQPIREAVLSKELCIGRGAIREALNLLVALDVLEYTPYCGYRLLPCTPRDILEWYDIRLALEPRALELLLEQPWIKREHIFSEMSKILDEEEKHIESNNYSGIWHNDISFHLKIVEGSNNRRMSNLFLRSTMPFLASYESVLGTDLNMRDYNQINMSKDELCHTNTRHRQLLEIMHHGEPEEAVKELRRHLNFSRKSIFNFMAYKNMESYPESLNCSTGNIRSIVDLLLK